MDNVDVAVVGLGLAGSAAAYALSRRGHRVAAFEAFAPGHRRGGSHGRARIFRRAYLDPLYVDLTGRAGVLWDRLSDDAGERLLTHTGGVDHGPERDPESMAALLRAHGVAAELVPDPASRWPGMRFEGPAVYDPEGGVLDPEAAMAAMARLARERGAHVAYETPVRGLAAGADGAVVRTDTGEWHARTVVVAAGGWAGPLLDGLVPMPPLTVTQQQVLYFASREPGPWPTVVHGDDELLGVYALPEGPYIKVGGHTPGKETTADGRDFIVDPEARDRLLDYVRRWLPGLDPTPRDEVTCIYTSTPNEDFVLDRYGPFVVCSACSGHGAKFTPLLGELTADLVEGGPPIDRFALPG